MSSNRMFTIKTEIRDERDEEGECLQTTSAETFILWHQRYRYLSFKGLKTLQDKDMVRGLPMFHAQEVICIDCLSGKQTRKAILKASNWRADKLEGMGVLVAQQVRGMDYFKILRIMVENESGEVIKCLRIDRGGEFTSNDFNDYCTEHEIKRQLTTAYTPQQNGAAERRNRTIMNMVRALFTAKAMPKTIWPEAVLWTVYVLNRCPTLTVKDKTPQEAWSGIKPSVEHFKVWDCVAHAHVPKLNRSKLDSMSKTCVFLGINEGTKGYRLVDTESKRIIVSRDVIFEQDKAWNWKEDYSGQVKVELEWEDGLLDDVVEPQVPEENPTGDIKEKN
ncbi:hypothetical protein LIER_28410 [Lithospermum erythrorhizon]|uniref:Integrase catalytic domain-containing protein n=1 Tax=Lithospermum erythrorhizon TaxID=34254 RepID=A0AAV3RFZ0_LITER